MATTRKSAGQPKRKVTGTAPKGKAKPKGSSPETYTDPKLRDRIKAEILAGEKGGHPGQWSARKSQLLAAAYKKAGGGYKTTRSKQAGPQKHPRRVDRRALDHRRRRAGRPRRRDRPIPPRSGLGGVDARPEEGHREQEAGRLEAGQAGRRQHQTGEGGPQEGREVVIAGPTRAGRLDSGRPGV